MLVDLFSFGRAAARATLSQVEGPPTGESRLLQRACQLSLRSDVDSVLEIPEGLDPLWPALARHLCRRSDDDDRALLIDLAQHPEKREPPLSWGLQYTVRGDVLFEDGSVMTLDEICHNAGIDPPPYLEDMPDELEVDWDAD